jgi:hypothetical protein
MASWKKLTTGDEMTRYGLGPWAIQKMHGTSGFRWVVFYLGEPVRKQEMGRETFVVHHTLKEAKRWVSRYGDLIGDK